MREHDGEGLEGGEGPEGMGKGGPAAPGCDPDSGRLEVRLLGSPTVLLEGRRVEAFSAQRLQRLLALMSLQPEEGMPRARAAFRLWPESTEAQAHTNLRKLIHDLRRVAPGIDAYAEIGQQQLRWRAGSGVSVDLVDIVAALNEGDDRSAVALYGGDLLPDCYDDWVIEERETLRTKVGEALDRLAAGAEKRGDDAEVISHTRARLALDPLWEPGYRRLMRAYSQLGNRSEALRTYHRCAEALQAELGVDPDPRTQSAYEQIHAAGAQSEVPRYPATASAALVGRASELSEAVSVWKDAAGGHASLLVVTGEPGIGKTRLVDELARHVRSESTLGRSRAYEAAGRLPWGPVVEWLRSPEIHSTLSRLGPPWREELGPLLPELRDSGADKVAGLDRAARKRLFDAIVRALTSTERPSLLVIDDLQWCDTDTLELIGFLISSLPTSPVLVAGTVRDEEINDGDPLATLISGLGRNEALHQIALSSLDVTATVELARRLTGGEISSDAADRLWRETAGNPLFVVEAARAVSSKGGPNQSGSLTPTIRSTINSRLDRLSDSSRSLAELAAVFGRQFSFRSLADAAGGEESDVSDAIDELWRRRILREQHGSYDFTHDKIREVAYDRLGPLRRRLLHRRVSEALALAYGGEPGTHSAELAAHLEASGQIAEAVDAHQHAAEHAATVFALDEVIASARRGLALLDQLVPGATRDERELRLRLALGAATVARHGYDAPAAEDSYERCVILSRRLDRPVEPPALRGLGLASVVSCRFDRSSRFGEALVALDEDPVARTEGHYLLGVSSFWRGDLATAERHLDSALSSYEPSLGPIHLRYFAQDPKAVCLVRLALIRLWRGDPCGARDIAEEARRFATVLGHPMTLGYVLTYSAMIACELEDHAWFSREVTEGSVLADEGLGWVVEVMRLFLAWHAFLEGEGGALQALEDAADQVTRLHLTHGLSLVARAHHQLGEFDRGMSAVSEALAWEAEHDQPYANSLLRRIEGDLLRSSGDIPAASAAFSSAAEVARAQGARWLEHQAATRIADLSS